MNKKKIAILRANALGDFLVTLPAIQSLKEAHGAEITLLGAPWHKEFLEPKRTAVDRVIVVPECEGIRGSNYASQKELDEFFEQMRREKFDMAIHFQGNGLSANPFLLKLGAPFTAGCTSPGAPELTRSIPFYYYQNEVMRYLEVASLAGGKPVTPEAVVDILAEDEQEVSPLLKLIGQKKIIAIHPFSADVRREWHDIYYTPLADMLAEKGYEIVFTGMHKDKARVNQIIDSMNFEAFNACGSFSLGGLSALYKKAALVIAPDTGPLHLARAVGTPTVGMYWAPNFINWAPLLRCQDRPVISWKMECSLCGVVPNDPYPFLPQQSCKHEISFISDISADVVAQAAFELLEKHENGHTQRKPLQSGILSV